MSTAEQQQQQQQQQQQERSQRRRARNIENASQTQVHHFDEQEDEQEEEEDEEGEDEDDEEDDEDRSHRRGQSSRLTADPYNTQQMSQPHHDYSHGAQQAYDSMSTILEVDSEAASQVSHDSTSATSERPRDLGSPLEVQTTPTTRRARGEQSHLSGSPVGGLSPGDKFGGTLSALAAQMERLQKKQSSYSKANRNSSSSSSSSSSSLSVTPEGDLAGRSKSDSQEPKDRLATSAESLMMINISPIGSPRVKFPLAKQKSNTSNNSPIVEVSNKSTNTLIDFHLMHQMAEKFFVEHSDKSTQSIKFDCDDDVLELNRSSTGSRQTTQVLRPLMKSIAVGTEKFSRERFSLLPSTKTRSTQTKANMSDSDIGTSETRRFKLSHLSNLGPIIKTQQQRRTTGGETTPEEVVLAARSSPSGKVGQKSRELNDSDDSLAVDTNKISEPQRTPSSRQVVEPEREATARQRKLVETSTSPIKTIVDSMSSSSDSTSYTSDDSLGNQSKKIATNSKSTAAKQISLDTKQQQTKEQNAGKTLVSLSEEKKVEDQPRQQQQQIPSLKTELRVIIEFADSRNKQRNEMLSNSNLINGILNKRTEISTSKHVAVSPRQVLERLQSVGQRHSLMYLPSSAPPVGSHLNNQHLSIEQQPASSSEGWQEVSRSTVCNEIESDTNKRKKSEHVHEQLIMSSDATIKQLADAKSAIHLRSRATSRQQHPTSPREKLLVESEAAFDESQLAADGQEQPRGQVRDHRNPTKSPVGQQQAPPAAPLSIRSPQTLPSIPNRPSATQQRQSVPSHEQPRFLHSLSPNVMSTTTTMRPNQAPRPQPIVMRDEPSPLDAPLVAQHLQRAHRAPPLRRGPSQQPQATSTMARLEFEEEKEDRRRITQNGRLVYDDRLREHHFESRRESTPTRPPQPTSQPPSGSIMRHSPRERTIASSPNLNATTGDRWRQRQPPVQQQHHQLSASSTFPTRLANTEPPPMFADQTSNLSSDVDTMDSGFVHSGAGSSSNLLNQQQQQQQQHNRRRPQMLSTGSLGLSPRLQSAPTSPISAKKSVKPKLSKHNDQDEEDNSLTFVDDDDDDFVDQLGGSSRQINRFRAKQLKGKERPQPGGDGKRNFRLHGLISPPLEFRNTRDDSHYDDSNRMIQRSGSMPRLTSRESTIDEQKKPSNEDSELITRLTRCKFKKQQVQTTNSRGPAQLRPKRRTLTKLEQNLTAPESLPNNTKTGGTKEKQPRNRYQFRAQVMFESDTDTSAVATDRQSVASGSSLRTSNQARLSKNKISSPSARKKEMITKTSYTLNNGGATDWMRGIKEDESEANGVQVESSRSTGGEARIKLGKKEQPNGLDGGDQQRARATSLGSILMPNWDYSLKVNRMRGNRCDSRVKTFIKHSRRPSLAVD